MSYEPYGSTTAPDDGGKADAAKSAASDTAHTAKDQAADVAHSAKASGQHLASEAKHEAADVGREAGRQVKGLFDQGRGELTNQASEQQKKLAGGLRSFSSELGSMADGAGESGESGLATDLTRRLADQTDSVASWFEDREPGDLLDEVKRFARNKPGTFLAIAAGAGLLAGRLTRGVKDAHTDDDETVDALQGRTTSTGATGVTGTSGTTTGAAYVSGTGSTTYGTGAVHGTTAGAAADLGAGTAAGDPTGGVERRSVSEGYADASTRSTIGEGTGSGYGTSDQPTQRLDVGENPEAAGTWDTPGDTGAGDSPWTPVEGEGEHR